MTPLRYSGTMDVSIWEERPVSHFTDEDRKQLAQAIGYLDSAKRNIEKALEMESPASSHDELHDAMKDIAYAEARVERAEIRMYDLARDARRSSEAP